MDILKRIVQIRKENCEYSGKVEEAVFVFKGIAGETLVRRAGFAGKAVKVIVAFAEKPFQSNYYEIFEFEKIHNLVPRLAVKTAILCVPHKEAAGMAEQLIKSGVVRILNWSGEFIAPNANAAILSEEPPCICE